VTVNTYIVLFRGINVGGNKVVRMELLRKMLSDLGFGNVATYIQSGNVVLTSEMPVDGVTTAIEGAFSQTFGFTSRPTVRSLAQWQRVIEDDPFGQSRSEGKQMHVVFLDEQPAKRGMEALQALATTEQMALRDGALYLFTPDGFGRSKVAEALDKVLKVPLTARNWNTVLKLASMAEAANEG
jgi:uncharacterized protein (DUF1697 family)